jgi:hypothetical protein
MWGQVKMTGDGRNSSSSLELRMVHNEGDMDVFFENDSAFALEVVGSSHFSVVAVKTMIVFSIMPRSAIS